jgi:hypothetical protein
MNMCVCERERNGREGGNALMHGWTANTETKREVFHVVCPTKDKKNSSTSQKPASIRVNRKKAASKFKNKQESVMKFNQMRKNKKNKETTTLDCTPISYRNNFPFQRNEEQ